jgi:hypothetical protein
MTRKEANRLKIGDRVTIWPDQQGEASGAIIEVGYCAIKFQWDDGEVSIIHKDDMENVERARAAA